MLKAIRDIFTLGDDTTFDHTRVYFFFVLVATIAFQWWDLSLGHIFQPQAFGTCISLETAAFGLHLGINSWSGNK
jgi:hypothetical protein